MTNRLHLTTPCECFKELISNYDFQVSLGEHYGMSLDFKAKTNNEWKNVSTHICGILPLKMRQPHCLVACATIFPLMQCYIQEEQRPLLCSVFILNFQLCKNEPLNFST